MLESGVEEDGGESAIDFSVFDAESDVGSKFD